MSEIQDVDLEVQEIFQNRDVQTVPDNSQNSHVILHVSPVLNAIGSDRKTLLGRRRSFKSRARIKLTDRFESSLKEKTEPLAKNLSKSSVVISGLDERVEENGRITDDSCFKKPLSPSNCPIFSPKLKSRNQFQNLQFKTTTSEVIELNKSSSRNNQEFLSSTGGTNQVINSSEYFSNSIPRYTDLNKNIHSIFIKNSKNEIDELSLTQEISDSGITNSQISSAFDNVLENIKIIVKDEDFSGFSSEEISISEHLYNNFVNCITFLIGKSSLINITLPKNQINRRRKFDTLFLPPCKKRKEEQDMEQHGFSTASGNKISISASSFKKATGIFDNLDCPSEKLKSFDKIYNDIASKVEIKTGNYHDNLDKSEVNQNLKVFNTKVLKCVSSHQNNLPSSSNVSLNHSRGQFKRNFTKNKLKFFDDLISGSETENISDVGFLKASGKPFCAPNAIHLDSVNKGFQNLGGAQRRNSPQEPCVPKAPKILSNQEVSRNKLKYFDIMIDGPENTKQSENCASPAHPKGYPVINSTNFEKKTLNQQFSSAKLKYFDQMFGNREHSNPGMSSFSNSMSKSNTMQRSNSLPISTSIQSAKELQTESLLSRRSSPVDREKIITTSRVGVNIKMGPTMGFSTASGRSVQISEGALKKATDVFKDVDKELGPINKTSFSSANGGFSKPNSFVNPLKRNNTLGSRRKKRFGGIIPCKQISVSDEQLRKASLLFNENLSSLSPIRPFQIKSVTENPVSHSTPLRTNQFTTPNRASFSFGKFIDSPGTPIKPDGNYSQEIVKGFKETVQDFVIENSKVILTSPTKDGGTDWIEELEQERKRLEERLKIIQDRQKMLDEIKEEKSKVDGRPRRGILFQRKAASKKASFKTFVENMKPGDDTEESVLFYITPKNAGNLHFKESSTSLRTEDGALIIPTKEDHVGLTEISRAFKNMPGIEVRLIPKGWIENHFKWILWKLASYERMFTKKFQGALTIENVMQQLKYRYDREIDRAERPALRRIFEKDDAPQKRLILCVSAIKQSGNDKYELELTDGWYPIRTVIDEPLCNQILNYKIKVGTKLIICDAEINNCEGCYPLEASDLVYLKINFNSTRRAQCYAKLGYQPIPGPFPVKIRTIHELGGPIGAINICVVRCYPLKYLEKRDNYSVWLNQRAEKRRAQEWENEQLKKFEHINEEIRNRLSQCYKTESVSSLTKNTITDISKITCPKELLDIMEKSNDPESIETKLSISQKQSMIEYKRDRFLEAQQEMVSHFSDDIEKLSKTKRTVSSSLKLLVVDVNDNPNRSFSFLVWHPTESYLDIMSEGSCLLVYNALPRRNCDLSSGGRTVFKSLQATGEMSIIFRRKVTEISDINDLKFPCDFREFDTVGLVVDVRSESAYQEVWLTTSSEKLLVVKIFEGASTCSLLDGLKRGQSTTVCNLVYHSLRDNIVHATGNHFTIFSCYSQYTHLQIGLEKFKSSLPQNLAKLLDDCDGKIHAYRGTKSNYSNCTNSSRTKYDSDEDTLVSSQLSRTDIALSMIDVDKIQ